MKIVCISDTHNSHSEIQIPDGDILIHAGDVSFHGEKQVYSDFDWWLGKHSHKHKILVAGNHDFGLYNFPFKNATLLQNQEVNVMGLRIWGSPITPTYGPWAFMENRGDDIKRRWDLIPNNVDILITHGPALGTLDMTPRGEKVGCYDLAQAIDRVRPRLHVFGHIHHGYGKLERQGLVSVNASICDEDYAPQNKAIVVEL